MSAASEYAELLKLIEVSGPFLSLPVFRETFPQGLAKDAPELTREMKELYEEWRVARASSQSFVSPAQREWLKVVFRRLLEWPAEWLAEDNAIPQNLSHTVAQHHETLRPDIVLMDAGKPRLLISVLAPAQQPDRRPSGTTWNATCATRMAELLHATRIPVGLVTNGERFTLVYAEPGQPTGFADFRAELWFDERLTLRAFRDFLSADALFNRPAEQAIEGLYRRSLQNQQEVSITLGRQVRRAVEVFVAALDRADRESNRTLLAGVSEEHVYEAALSLMMRLVFLFFAEERDLLPMTNPVYRENYAVSTLHDQLRESADRLGEEVLERRYDAFPRLLATFRAVHGGVEHDLASLPAYGGDLFDPNRFPFLEGRSAGSDWHAVASRACPIHNRTVLHLLTALQFLEIKLAGGTETRRLSFQALDIEQIGHVYEGLLDHTVRRAKETILALEGSEAANIPLSELEKRSAQPGFEDWLAEETGRTAKAIEKALREPSIADPLRWPDWESVSRFAPLVRRDDNGDPGVIPADSLYVTAGAARRQTGTQYTPRTLTESVVEHALGPQVYFGPAEGLPPEKWVLKSAAQILSLKVCDFACGSAAFLVAAARYLSSHLMEAWGAAQKKHGTGISITPYGDPSLGLPDEELIPSNPDECGLYALRITVERCLYGVDRNHLAVEMAKLSLWLLTLQRNKPFTFLDHAIRCGDSLLGVDLKQLSTWSLSGDGSQTVLFHDDLAFAADRRDGLTKLLYHPRDQQRQLDAALAKTRRLRAAADLLIATAFEPNPDALAGAVAMALDYQEAEAQRTLSGKHPFHWPVEFPEVFLYGGGFDAIIGNPPYIGGQRITGAFGQDYRDYLVNQVAGGQRGSADYVAYFFLRAFELLKPGATCGLIATKTIAEGQTREVGLDSLGRKGASIYRAISSQKWPGDAKLSVAWVWWRKGEWKGLRVADEKVVESISAKLSGEVSSQRDPYKLKANAGMSRQGSILVGMGFVISEETADALIAKDPKNREVVRPLMGGKDITDRWQLTPSRWVINFYDWPIEKAREFPECFELVEQLVKPVRTRKKPDGTYQLRYPRYERWWQYGETCPDLYSMISTFERVIVAVRVSAYHCVAFAPSNIVYSDRLVVFGLHTGGEFALLASSIHDIWAHRPGVTKHDTRNTYFPEQAFDTFPLAVMTPELDRTGEHYSNLRQRIMSDRKEGLTDLYNCFHRRNERSDDINCLRSAHVSMDRAVVEAYGWKDLDLEHDFHETKQGTRYTISERARGEVLDRLIALNQARYAEEHASASETIRPKRRTRSRAVTQPGLF